MSWFRADGSLAYWWMAALPICALLFIQIFPLPQWVIGFITGTLITGPLVGYVTWSVTKDDGKSGAGIRQVPFDEKIGQKVAKKPAIYCPRRTGEKGCVDEPLADQERALRPFDL